MPEYESAAEKRKLMPKIVFAAAFLFAAVTILQSVMDLYLERASDRLFVRELFFIALFLPLIIAAVRLLNRLVKSDAALLGMTLCVCFFIRLVFIAVVRTPLESDFAVLYNAAIAMVNGDYSWTDTVYFKYWAYQIPFVCYEALITAVFKSSFAVKILNLIFMTGIDFLIYLIACKFAMKRAAILAAFLYAVYPAPVLLASVLTNQHISTFFILLGIYLILKGPTWKNALLSGLCIGFGNLMRPEGIVVMAALLFMSALFAAAFLKEKITALRGKKPVGAPLPAVTNKNLLMPAAVILTYFVFMSAASAVFSLTPAAPHGIDTNRPEWKFILGLNPESSGGYTESDRQLLGIEDDALRRDAVLSAITGNIGGAGDIPSFMWKKTSHMWGFRESAEWPMPHITSSAPLIAGFDKITMADALSAMLTFDKAVYIIALLLFAPSCLMLYKRRGLSPFLLTLIFCANYAAYLLVETQTRYRYFIMPVVFILGAVFGEKLWKKRRLRDIFNNSPL